MATVLTLMIIGWLIAFALGSQAGFDSQPAAKAKPAQSVSSDSPANDYREPASVA